MKEITKNKIFSILFKTSMCWRIFYGFFKLVLGIFLLQFINTNFSVLLYKVFGYKSIEHLNGMMFGGIKSIFKTHTFYVTYFIVIYFIFWGAVDVFLSFNLLKLRLWSYPVSLFLITIFTLYETYRFTHTHSLILGWIIFIDIFLIWLIYKEYKKLKNGLIKL